MPTRTTYLAATINGFAITRILSAQCAYSWKRSFPEATIYVPLAPQNTETWQASHAYGTGAYVKPTTRNGHMYVVTVAGTSGGSQPSWPPTNGGTVTNGSVTFRESGIDIVYDDEIEISMGAGNNVVRFRGLFRKFTYSLFPRAVGLVCFGYLVRAHDYENIEGTPELGGLSLFDLVGSVTATDADVVQAVLTRVGITYTGGDIDGTGVTWGSRSDLHRYPYVWRAGMLPGVEVVSTGYGGVGQKALDYIQEWDKVSAVFVDATHASGFYRTYETVNGVFRALIGGRPRSSVDFTFSEGIDIEQNGVGTREYPMANAAYVTGADFPGIAGANPVRNVDFSTGAFVGQSSNPFQPTSLPVTYEFSSPFIEWALESDAGIGMNCERVGNALLQDLNRETVTASFRTPIDVLIQPGHTILVQGPGGQPDRLGLGEPLWVDSVTTGVDESGMFYQDIQGTGGGLADAYTPAPEG